MTTALTWVGYGSMALGALLTLFACWYQYGLGGLAVGFFLMPLVYVVYSFFLFFTYQTFALLIINIIIPVACSWAVSALRRREDELDELRSRVQQLEQEHHESA